MAVWEPPDYRKLYDEQCKQTESLRHAVEVLRETLRDQFAMAALTGLCFGRQERVSTFAAEAYNIADAMLEARKPSEAVPPQKEMVDCGCGMGAECTRATEKEPV